MSSSDTDLISRVQFVFGNAPFVKLVGIELVEVEPGKCLSRLHLEQKHFQHLGRVHGAVLAALAGQTALGAATSVIRDGEYVVCPDFKVSLLEGATEGPLLSSAKVIKSGKLLVFVEADITEEGNEPDKVIARASYTFTRLQNQKGV